jgi:hypothetical protein
MVSVKAAPTFKAGVSLRQHGTGKVETLTVEFKHRTKSQMNDFVEWAKGKADGEIIMACVVGWDAAEPFSEAAVAELLENFSDSGLKIYEKYFEEIFPASLGN